jgi:hypothetical protein
VKISQKKTQNKEGRKARKAPVVFLGSSCSCRETAKNTITKNRREKTRGRGRGGDVSQLFWPKAFDIDFPQKVFGGVFELPLLRNAQKRH